MMMMPGLTEEECQRYQELLEVRCQYERRNEKQQKEALKNVRDDIEANDWEERKEEEKEGEEDTPSSSAVDVNCTETLSEHEMALIEEELRHLEFKCRNILRAQKMQQLRERCLKAWMMEEETVAAAAGQPGPPEAGNHGNHRQPDILTDQFSNHETVSHNLIYKHRNVMLRTFLKRNEMRICS